MMERAGRNVPFCTAGERLRRSRFGFLWKERLRFRNMPSSGIERLQLTESLLVHRPRPAELTPQLLGFAGHEWRNVHCLPDELPGER